MSLESDDIDEYIRKRKDEEAANGTIMREIQMLKAAINRKVRKASLVMDQIKNHAKLKGNIKKGIISLEDFERFVEELPDYMKLMIRITHFTGARPGEIRELKWEQVDFRECRLNFDWDETKEGYDKSIKISDELIVELQTLYKMAEKGDRNVPICPYVFQGPYRKNKLISERTYYLAWNDSCERIGPPFIKLDKIKKNGRPEATFTPHDLRRTRITMGINAGENPKAIMKQTGHKTMQVFHRYNIVDNTNQDELVKRQIENDEKLSVKEEAIKKEYEARTAEAVKRLESIYWSVDDDEREVLDSVMNEFKKAESDVHKVIEDLDNI
jgi:integrase